MKLLTLTLVFTALFCTTSMACTDFKLTSKDGSLLITRSMEFGQDLQSNLRTSPRGRTFTSTLNDKTALSWNSKYGYLYLDGFNVDATFDGMNEEGLTFEYLYLPGETVYQTLPKGKENQAIPYLLFGDWVLGNFKTIAELKQALDQVYVVNQTIPQLGDAVLPAHAAVHDSSGEGIVIEFYNNKINVSKNIGIMTNSPKYEWHVSNLRNYVNLSATNPDPITQGNMVYTTTGQGTGAIGLPGDASPPSRFVKIAFMLGNVYPGENIEQTLNLAEHIINNVDLPAGFVRSIEDGTTQTDTTQWVVFKDISNKVFYYRTYQDMTLHRIDLTRINFSDKESRLKMPLAKTPYLIDETEKFVGTVQKAVA